jgi:hypothetical protein
MAKSAVIKACFGPGSDEGNTEPPAKDGSLCAPFPGQRRRDSQSRAAAASVRQGSHTHKNSDCNTARPRPLMNARRLRGETRIGRHGRK